MLLDTIPVQRLRAMLEPRMRRTAWPGLDEAAVRRRARRWAKRLGIWDRLSRLDPGEPVSHIRRSDFRGYRRTGERAGCERIGRARLRRTVDAALALWLGHPAADLDHLQDLLWAWCETTTWIWPAHEGRTVDLASSMRARLLAEIAWMLEDELEDEVKERVRAEVTRRILDGATDWRRPDGWQTTQMNWSHVCNSNVIQCALYVITDPRILAAFIHPFIRRLDYGLNGFAADGGCREGPGYWNYGFGNFLDAAVVLHNRTGGALDIMKGERIAAICRYPLAAHIEGPYRASFADGGHGYISAESALEVNRFLDMPELYPLAARDRNGYLAVRDWRGLSLFTGERAEDASGTDDCVLPGLGMVKLRSGRRPKGATLLALAGSNDVPHNHNDVGSFIYFARGAPLLTDPGAPRYTAKTFGPRRYEILFCRSRGHSVPVVNGAEQSAGGRFRGTLEVHKADGAGEKRAVIDMTRAYDVKGLKKLVRELTLREDGSLRVADAYEFARRPKSVEEAFVTYEKASVVRRGAAVRIGPRGRSVTITWSGAPGSFAAERLVEESKEGRSGGVVTRVTFRPRRLERRTELIFDVR